MISQINRVADVQNRFSASSAKFDAVKLADQKALLETIIKEAIVEYYLDKRKQDFIDAHKSDEKILYVDGATGRETTYPKNAVPTAEQLKSWRKEINTYNLYIYEEHIPKIAEKICEILQRKFKDEISPEKLLYPSSENYKKEEDARYFDQDGCVYVQRNNGWRQEPDTGRLFIMSCDLQKILAQKVQDMLAPKSL